MNDNEIKEKYLAQDQLILKRETRKWCLEKALQHQSTASVETLVKTASSLEEYLIA